MKHIFRFAIFLLMTFSVSSVFADVPRDPYKYFFNDTFGDFREELQTARAQGKQGVLVFFELDECPFCHYMKEHVLNQPEVQAYFREHFLNFVVDIEGDVDMTNFQGAQMKQKDFSLKENRVRATPVFGIFDLDGKLIARFTGRTSGVDEFMLFGRYVVEGRYKDEPFLKFKRSVLEKASAL